MRWLVLLVLTTGCVEPGAEDPTATLSSALVTDAGVPDAWVSAPGRLDVPALCIRWGRVTYNNTIGDLLGKHCTKCHGPQLQLDAGLGSGYAVAPKAPDLAGWGSVNQEIAPDAGLPELIVGRVETRSMPPSQTEAELDDPTIARFVAWGEAGHLQGHELPSVTVTKVTKMITGKVRIYYSAQDRSSGNAKVALFWDTNAEGFDGTAIAGCLTAFPGSPYTGSYLWTPPPLPPGPRHIYGCIFDGDNVHCDYATNPVTLP